MPQLMVKNPRQVLLSPYIAIPAYFWGPPELPWLPWFQFLGAQISSNITQGAGEPYAGLFQGKRDMEVIWCNVNVSLNFDLPSLRRIALLRKYFVCLWHGVITTSNSDYWQKRWKGKTTVPARSCLNTIVYTCKQIWGSIFWIILHMTKQLTTNLCLFMALHL